MAVSFKEHVQLKQISVNAFKILLEFFSQTDREHYQDPALQAVQQLVHCSSKVRQTQAFFEKDLQEPRFRYTRTR